MSIAMSMADNKQQRVQLYEKLIQFISQKLSKDQVALLSQLIPRYYSNVAVQDLINSDLIDLYGALFSHWLFMYDRAPLESKVRVYNPEYEKHGWQSKHTIIEISHDDLPFLVDSTRLELNRRSLTIYLCIHTGGIKVRRNAKNQIVEILQKDTPDPDLCSEAPIFFEIDRITDPKVLEDIKLSLEKVLAQVQLVVSDWKPMCHKMENCIKDLSERPPKMDSENLKEHQELLRWLLDDHITFLGTRDYKLINHEGKRFFEMIDHSSLGLLKDESRAKKRRSFDELPKAAQRLLISNQPLIFTKRSKLSTVHRDDYLDRIEVKHFDKEGKVTGLTCFIVLFTSVVYNSRPEDIPLLRVKIKEVFSNSRLRPNSHGGKELLNILETLPRDDLFHCTVDELTELGMGILFLQERRLVKMFLRRDIYCRFVSLLVYFPRDRFDSNLRQKIQDFLAKTFNAKQVTFTTRFSESVLARVHFLIHVEPENFPKYDALAIEQKLSDMAELWSDDLRKELVEIFGEELGNLYTERYSRGFSAGYMEDYSPRSGAYDIQHMEEINEHQPLTMNLYQPLDHAENMMQFKIFGSKDAFPLTKVMPILENMGLNVIGERPHIIQRKGMPSLAVVDFTLSLENVGHFDLEKIKNIFQETFSKIWAQEVENDGFNRLVIMASLDFRQITILRAYSKYLAQTCMTFSQSYVEAALSHHPEIARLMVQLFITRFDPVLNKSSTLQQQEEIEQQILTQLDAVSNFDEDRIIRSFLEVIKANIRTNYFQTHSDGSFKNYLSFKFNSSAISELPLPKPLYEIFVYSPIFEGVHLRAAKVARGGLRWSDRREDFRTEVLGLMKAQQVKNVVIVPSGAKGGFVIKSPEAAVVDCYQNFIRGLLDLTDNLQAHAIISPENTVRYDSDDPYLVVAADKGTSTFSDIANGISAEYNFWLGDAFASGGSAGYDHKKIAITAKGAWECVKRHFRKFSIDIQNTDFMVIGIGDMSGDVFGNGMLLSKHIKLIAAFDHRHIFVDPNPDPAKSFKERERLFNLPRSSWQDYNAELISKGGGVFNRLAKSIKLSNEIKEVFEIHQNELIPAELIKVILQSKVDLLWNGGIGTFVKASRETHNDVGDRTSDGIRVNGLQLRCKVVGEGGNLGFTQLGRVEYELSGGLINTDFIDNSGGVDCSDREVNSKILLNHVMEQGNLTLKQRNELLFEMTDEVSSLVTRTNYAQAQAISLAILQAKENPDLYIRYISYLEEHVHLDRTIEFLPDDKTLNERKLHGNVMTRPEISVLLSYTKIYIKQELLRSDILEDPELVKFIGFAFPTQLRKNYSEQMLKHRLRREIIANVLCNDLVNYMGLTFVYRLQGETGASVGAIVKSYITAVQIFDFYKLWKGIESLDHKVFIEAQERMMILILRMIRRAARWLLYHRSSGSISEHVNYFFNGVNQLRENLCDLLAGLPKEVYENECNDFIGAKVPVEVAHSIGCARVMFSALDIIEASKNESIDLLEFGKSYFALGNHLDLGWLRRQLSNYIVQNQWESMSIAGLRDDLDLRQRLLTTSLLKETSSEEPLEKRIENFISHRSILVHRWKKMLHEMRAYTNPNLIMYSVALRELFELNQASTIPESRNSDGEIKKKKSRT